MNQPVAGQTLAIVAEGLFLANLLAAPVVAFAVLAWLWASRRNTASPLARCHLDQAFIVSVRGGVLLAILVAAFMLLDGIEHLGPEWTWTIVVVYFTCVHSVLVTLGIVALARAMAGRTYRYPWIGPRHATQ